MTREEIREWLAEWLADQLGISPEDVEMDRSFASYGLDADDLARLVSAIEESFEESLEADVIRGRSTLTSTTRLLCELSGADEEDADSGEEPARDVDMDELARDIGLQ